MVIKRELARWDDRLLIEVQFVGVSGQVCSRNYEVDGPEKLYFATRQEAEAALRAGPETVAAYGEAGCHVFCSMVAGPEHGGG